MRPPALVLAILFLAGCTGGPPGPSATSPPVTTTAEPATSTPATPPVTATPPPPREPVVVYERTYDFQTEPAPTPKLEPFNVTAGAASLRANVSFSTTAQVGLTATVNVRILDPTGEAALVCAKDACQVDVPTPRVGTWHAEYTGAGTSRAAVRVVVE